jgi:hypothetical protein
MAGSNCAKRQLAADDGIRHHHDDQSHSRAFRSMCSCIYELRIGAAQAFDMFS